MDLLHHHELCLFKMVFPLEKSCSVRMSDGRGLINDQTLFDKFMKLLSPFLQLLCRLRYPVSTPEEVGADLGIHLSNDISFKEFINCLIDPRQRSTKLIRFMPRAKAEEMFQSALRKEKFQNDSLFSYHFKTGWMEFSLQFDEQSRLRRIYMRHKELKKKHEFPIS